MFCSGITLVVLLTNIVFAYNIVGYMAVPPVIALISTIRVMLTCPGVILTTVRPPDEMSDAQKQLADQFAPEKYGYIVRPRHANWSQTVGAMILDYDHFCPWVNNAVGLLNIRYFLQFLTWVSISCLWTIGYIFSHIVHCYLGERKSCGWLYFNRAANTPQILFSVLFGLFTLAMSAEQLRNLQYGQTTIDRLKDDSHQTDTVQRYFGGYSVIGRLLPTPNIPVMFTHGEKSVAAAVDQLTDHGFTVLTGGS